MTNDLIGLTKAEIADLAGECPTGRGCDVQTAIERAITEERDQIFEALEQEARRADTISALRMREFAKRIRGKP